MMNRKIWAAIGIAGVFAISSGSNAELPLNSVSIASSPKKLIVDGVADKTSIHLQHENKETNEVFRSFPVDPHATEPSRFSSFAKDFFGVDITPYNNASKREGLRNLYNSIKEFPMGNASRSASENDLRGFYYHIIFMNSDEQFFEGLRAEKWTTFQLAHIASDLGLYCVRFRPNGGCFRPRIGLPAEPGTHMAAP